MQITPDSMLYYVVVLLIFGNVFALLIGVLMLVSPQRLSALSKLSNRWVSTRKFSEMLEKSRPGDRVLLSYPRALGAVLLASAALILIKGAIFITGVSAADGGRLLVRIFGDGGFSNSLWEILWLSLISFIALGAVLAVVVGLMSLLQPGQLKHWAKVMGRWISTRRLSKPLDVPHYHLDRLVVAQPRVWGGVITVLALFSAVILWWFVLGA